MLANANLTVFTVLVNSLEHAADHTVLLFRDQCNQIRDVYQPECQMNSLNGTEVAVFSNSMQRENRIDEVLETVWIKYLCEIKGCHVVKSTLEKAQLLIDTPPRSSRTFLPLFPYRTVRYSIYVRNPGSRVRLFAYYYIFSPTLWIALISSVGLIIAVALMIHSKPFSYNPALETLQAMYSLCLNNGSTVGIFRSSSSRILFVVCSALLLIVWISFSTFLIAELAVSLQDRLLGDVRLLLVDRKLKAICVEPESVVHAHLMTVIRPLVNVDPCPARWPQRTALHSEVCNSDLSEVAFVESSSFLHEYKFYYSGNPLPCDLFILMDNMFQVPKAIIARRGYHYKEETNQMFLKVVEHGVAQYVTNTMFDLLSKRITKEIIQAGYLNISIRQLGIIFSLLGVGFGLAAVIFILEWSVYFRRQGRLL